MAPAEVASIVVDEDKHTMDIATREDQLAQAIGKSGQNIKLASELTTWTLNVMTEEQAQDKSDSEAENLVKFFVTELNVTEAESVSLVEEGFSTLEDVAYIALDELVAVEGFDQETADALRQKAKNILLTRAIADEEKRSEPAEDLLALEGMTPSLARALAAKDIITREDLAEQAVDDIVDLDELDANSAAELIMVARAHWFE